MMPTSLQYRIGWRVLQHRAGLRFNGAKGMAVGAEIKVDKHLWDGADGVWQETTILDVRGAEVGVLQQRTTDGVTVRYESGDAENFLFEGDDGFNDQ